MMHNTPTGQLIIYISAWIALCVLCGFEKRDSYDENLTPLAPSPGVIVLT